jgi:hypothetical protein
MSVGDAQAGRIVDGRWTRMPVVLLRLAYLAVTNGLAMLRLLPMSDGAKDVEILALRHQLAVLERQLHGLGHRVRIAPTDRAFLAALLHRLPARYCTGCGCWCTQAVSSTTASAHSNWSNASVQSVLVGVTAARRASNAPVTLPSSSSGVVDFMYRRSAAMSPASATLSLGRSPNRSCSVATMGRCIIGTGSVPPASTVDRSPSPTSTSPAPARIWPRSAP